MELREHGVEAAGGAWEGGSRRAGGSQSRARVSCSLVLGGTTREGTEQCKPCVSP